MSSYQASYTYVPPATGTSTQTYFPQFPHLSLAPPVPHVPSLSRPPSPDPLGVTPEIASKTIQRLVSSELAQVGFNSAQVSALKRIESDVVTFVEQLYRRAHEYANLANRSGPIVTDLMLACEDAKLSSKELRTTRNKTKKRKRKSSTVSAPKLELGNPRPSSPELLGSDDEGVPPSIPVTLRTMPRHFPSFPPKHTYQQTPAAPPERAALPSLEKKLKTASLVQDSLENLLLATEDSSGQKDAELLGHIVNWETNIHPRKNWKLSLESWPAPAEVVK
ncbi:hypothetical protein C8J56DRAFT_935141 [Mycena floridula]|nr:hypothetical protein C8J56DRAFT_935141 [Mycena floridula]